MTDPERLIQLRLTGSRTGPGSIELDALLAFGEHFRRALRATARERAGADPVLGGRPTTSDEQASALRIVGLSEGSALLDAEGINDELLPPVFDSLRDLGQALADHDVSQTVHDALGAAVRSLGDDGSVSVASSQLAGFLIDAQLLESIVPRPTAIEVEPVTHVDGWLYAVDLSPDDFRVRDASGVNWVCHFEDGLKSTVRALLDSQVRVIGDPTTGSGSKNRIQVTGVRPLAPVGVPLMESGLSTDEVLRQAKAEAGLTAPQPLSALRSELGQDDPEVLAFDKAIREIS